MQENLKNTMEKLKKTTFKSSNLDLEVNNNKIIQPKKMITIDNKDTTRSFFVGDIEGVILETFYSDHKVKKLSAYYSHNFGVNSEPILTWKPDKEGIFRLSK